MRRRTQDPRREHARRADFLVRDPCAPLTVGKLDKELGFAIGLKDIELRNEMRHVLEQLANECHDVGEPPITALVVNAQTGAPGAGWHGNGEPWHADVQRVFRFWAAQS